MKGYTKENIRRRIRKEQGRDEPFTRPSEGESEWQKRLTKANEKKDRGSVKSIVERANKARQAMKDRKKKKSFLDKLKEKF